MRSVISFPLNLLASVTSIIFSAHSGMTDDQKTSISMPGGESSFGPLDFNKVVLPNLPTTSISTTGGRSSISTPGVPMPIGEYCVCSSIFIKQEDVAHQQPVTSTGRNSGEAMYPANRCFFREPGQSSLALPRTTSKSLTAVSVLLLAFKGFDQLVTAHEGGLSLGDSFSDSTFRNIGLYVFAGLVFMSLFLSLIICFVF
jgi:hypothetical protein